MLAGHRTRNAIVVIFAVAATAVFITWLWSIKVEYNNERDYKPQNYATQTKGVCIKIPPAIAFCPEQQSNPTAEAHRSDNDLQAQQEMADWAFVMAAFSVVGFVLSIFGIGLIYVTFAATQSTAEANWKAAHVSELDISPLIAIDTTSIVSSHWQKERVAAKQVGVYFEVKTEFRNTGGSAASGVLVALGGSIPKGGAIEDFIKECRDAKRFKKYVLLKGQEASETRGHFVHIGIYEDFIQEQLIPENERLQWEKDRNAQWFEEMAKTGQSTEGYKGQNITAAEVELSGKEIMLRDGGLPYNIFVVVTWLAHESPIVR